MEIEKLCPLTGRPCDGAKCMRWAVMGMRPGPDTFKVNP